MKPGLPAEKQGAKISSWVAVCPRGLWEVQSRQTLESGQGSAASEHTAANDSWSSSDYPRMGSLCRVRVRLKRDPETGSPISHQGDQEPSITPDQPITELTETQLTPMGRSQDSVLQVPLGDWTLMRLGEGHCDITEGCVEGMRAGQICEVLLTPLRPGFKAQPSDPLVLQQEEAAEEAERSTDRPLCFTVELHSFTPGRESWEIPPSEKWRWVRSHKERGGVRFRGGDVWGAADSYSRALKLLITLQHHTRERNRRLEGIKEEEEDEEQRDGESGNKTPEPPTDSNLPLPTETEYRTAKAELHSNLSLCQLKLHQPERARNNAAKATLLEPGGAKAWYRLGQACLQVAELDEARKAFKRLLELEPDSAAAQRGLREVGSRERETNNQLGQRLSKMFS